MTNSEIVCWEVYRTILRDTSSADVELVEKLQDGQIQKEEEERVSINYYY